MEINHLFIKNTSEEEKIKVIREEKQEMDLLFGTDTILNIATSVAVPYALLNCAISISSCNGGAAISNVLKTIGPGGVKGGIATLLCGAGTINIGMQLMQSFVGGKVLKADYAKGEKTKEEIINHVNRIPISSALKGSLIKKVRKFS